MSSSWACVYSNSSRQTSLKTVILKSISDDSEDCLRLPLVAQPEPTSVKEFRKAFNISSPGRNLDLTESQAAFG